MSLLIPRRTYADLYGPTKGDRIRLADTDLIIEIEKDFTHYGDEITFGGGKVIRDGMGQSSTALRESQSGALDLVITNAVILDHWGIVKGDIGIKNGRIVKVGKAGNPDTMDGVDSELVVGAATEVIAGEHLIVTAGGVDSHIHFISPQQVYAAISNVGGLAFFAFVVAPVAFGSLASAHEAGMVVGGTLRMLHWIGLIGGGVFCLATGWLWLWAEVPARIGFARQLALTAVMLVVTAYSQFSVLPAMEVDRALAGGEVETASLDNAGRVDFEATAQVVGAA